MKKLTEYFRSHIKLARALVLGYVVFMACFAFPIHNALGGEGFSMTWNRAYVLVAGYGVVATALAGVYGMGKEGLIYLKVLAFTVLGLVCRYLLEFGEVSNTYNFTLGSIAAYLLLIPLATTAAYRIMGQKMREKQP